MSTDHPIVIEVPEGTKHTLANLKCAPEWTKYPSVGVKKKTYRKSKHYPTYEACLASLFEWHTETLNAWTVLAHGAIHVAFFFFFLASRKLEGADLAFFLTHTVVVAAHALLAAGYHLFSPISIETHLLWRRLDGFGAYASFTATAALLAYYAFPAEAFFSVLAFSLLVQIVAYGEMICLWTPPTYLNKYRHAVWWKMVLAGLPQAIVLTYVGVSDVIEKKSVLLPVLAFLIIFFQVVGEEVYRRGFPERFVKGFGFPAGHVLMHVCILICDALLLIFAIALRDRKRT